MYTDEQWSKVTGEGATFLSPDVAAVRAMQGTRVYGLTTGDNPQIVRVHTLEQALGCVRVWSKDLTVVPILRA